MTGQSFITLLDLQRLLREGVEDAVPGKVWVRAQINSMKVNAQSGHCYLELSETERGKVVAKAPAMIWNRDFLMLDGYFRTATGSHLQAGQEVLVQVRVSYHEVWGLTLTIDDISPEFTLGEARMLRQKTLQRIEKEGLADLQKELCLPRVPRRLAVISAPDAAGFGDFRRHLAENAHGFAFITDLFPAVMQGEAAPESVCAALEAIAASGEEYDAVLLLRGGGSEMDLACFDDYSMAAAIARFPLPVFTAIGHDKDHHVADMVANQAVKTPTALADLFISRLLEEDGLISSLRARLLRAFDSRISAAMASLASLETGIGAAASRRVEVEMARMASMDKLIRSLVGARIVAEEARLENRQMLISLADPRAVLKRGVPLLADSEGVRFDRASTRRAGDRISVRLPDGRLDCTVEGVSLEAEIPEELEKTA